MSSSTGDSSSTLMKKPAVVSDVSLFDDDGDDDLSSSSSLFKDLQARTEELKDSLAIWRSVLLPLNNLLDWEHQYDPFVLIGIITFVFM
jgi:hypothetical protein